MVKTEQKIQPLVWFTDEAEEAVLKVAAHEVDVAGFADWLRPRLRLAHG